MIQCMCMDEFFWYAIQGWYIWTCGASRTGFLSVDDFEAAEVALASVVNGKSKCVKERLCVDVLLLHSIHIHAVYPRLLIPIVCLHKNLHKRKTPSALNPPPTFPLPDSFPPAAYSLSLSLTQINPSSRKQKHSHECSPHSGTSQTSAGPSRPQAAHPRAR